MAVCDRAETIRDMATRVVNNGAEGFYAAEKTGRALIEAAAIMRECGESLECVLELAQRGYERGC